jgi:hypothetical protein
MVPQTAAVEGLPGAVAERNQDYDLLSPGALIEASLGETVQLVRTNRKTGAVTSRPAVVRAGASGPVLEVDGHIEGLGCSGEPERLVFDRLPAKLTATPTFSVLADVPKAGRYAVRLSYLATGLAWTASYVATLAPDGRSLDLIGWVTLANQTSASFVRAPTEVVAGRVLHDEDETAPTQAEATPLTTNCWPILHRRPEIILTANRRVADVQGVPVGALNEIQEIVTTGSYARQSELGDYKLYTLPEPTTVAARQVKQVLFLNQRRVPFERIYTFRYEDDGFGDEDEAPVNVTLRMKNETAAGSGLGDGAGARRRAGPGGPGHDGRRAGGPALGGHAGRGDGRHRPCDRHRGRRARRSHDRADRSRVHQHQDRARDAGAPPVRRGGGLPAGRRRAADGRAARRSLLADPPETR